MSTKRVSTGKPVPKKSCTVFGCKAKANPVSHDVKCNKCLAFEKMLRSGYAADVGETLVTVFGPTRFAPPSNQEVSKMKGLLKRQHANAKTLYASVVRLEEMITSLDADSVKRFEVQLTTQKLIAKKIDEGETDTALLTRFQTGMKDILTRLDVIWGKETLDVLAATRRALEENRQKEIQLGW